MLGNRPLGADLDDGRLDLAWGTAGALADEPAKVMATSVEEARSMSVHMNIMDRVSESRRRVVISSPYFVPGRLGTRAFADLTHKGVKVVILTNSFAANDVPVVHIGYARYRPELLRSGVELYELSCAGVERSDLETFSGLSHGRLHAKAAVIDDTMVYIGSMNLDPRSDSTNTELGIFAQSPELARDIVRVIDASRQRSSYRLRFGSDGSTLQWIARRGEEDVVLTSEPEVTPAIRLRNMLLMLFVPEQLL
jgi:cardiolipin synthase C